VTTPKTPKDRVDILRKAFANTLKDPEFLLEAKKAGLEVNPLDGEEVKKVVDSLFALNPQIVAKLSSILTVKQ
jgi:tripartite-type tricarboxylate transporter receptor subunit TctC